MAALPPPPPMLLAALPPLARSPPVALAPPNVAELPPLPVAPPETACVPPRARLPPPSAAEPPELPLPPVMVEVLPVAAGSEELELHAPSVVSSANHGAILDGWILMAGSRATDVPNLPLCRRNVARGQRESTNIGTSLTRATRTRARISAPGEIGDGTVPTQPMTSPVPQQRGAPVRSRPHPEPRPSEHAKEPAAAQR